MPGHKYVGRSDVNVSDRLKKHIDSGKLDPNDFSQVDFVSDPNLENTLINDLGGPLSSNPNTSSSNKIWGKGARKR